MNRPLYVIEGKLAIRQMLISFGKDFVVVAQVAGGGSDDGFGVDVNFLAGGHCAADVFFADEVNGSMLVAVV